MKAPVPILRIFDEAMAREFYVGFLGFRVDWEHRFEPGLPLYCQISRGECVVHLSGHFGDATPGSAIRIETPGLSAYCAELRAMRYKHCRPGEPERMPWGNREITVQDPFGNRITLYEPAETDGGGTGSAGVAGGASAAGA